MCKILGVLNVTPDSFFDGGRYVAPKDFKGRVRQLIQEGVDFIDVGGESTRPSIYSPNGQLNTLTENEELARVLPVLAYIKAELSDTQNPDTQNSDTQNPDTHLSSNSDTHLSPYSDTHLSIDTRSPKVAEEALKRGAAMVNLVTNCVSKEMAQLMAKYPKASIVLCHMRGNPQQMQAGDFHDGPIIPYLQKWFHDQIMTLKSHGVSEKQMILDPGIGFGKRKPDQDLEILRGLGELKSLGFPLMIGLSRKSFMAKILGKPANELLAATIAANLICFERGVDYLRVHDVGELKDAMTIYSLLQVK